MPTPSLFPAEAPRGRGCAVDIFGEVLLDFLPDVPGRLREVHCFTKTLGGAPANVAVALARLGARPRLLARVSPDEFGHYLVDTLRLEGVDTSCVISAPGSKTPLVFVGLAPDGERSFAFHCEAAPDVQLDPCDWADLPLAPVLHLGSNLMPHTPGCASTLALMRRARRERRLVAFDVNLRLNLWPDAETARRVILDAMTLCDVVKLSEEEACFMCNRSAPEPPELVALLAERGVRYVVLTYGARGACLHGPGLELCEPAEDIAAIDTTGAGDAFWAGVLFGIANLSDAPPDAPQRWLDGLGELGWRRTLRLANHLGSRACTARGATTAVPCGEHVPWTELGW